MSTITQIRPTEAPADSQNGDGPLRHVYPWKPGQTTYAVEVGEVALCGHVCERGGMGGLVVNVTPRDCVVCLEIRKARCSA